MEEICLKCDWWNFTRSACDRIVKVRLRIAVDGGEIDIETQPGLIPKDLEDEFTLYLADAIGHAVDSYPGWKEVKNLRLKKGCAGHQENKAIKEFGCKLSLVKPVTEANPLKNVDSHGLFKSDISIW